MTVYLDASAAAKLLLEEPESPAMLGYLRTLDADTTVISSILIETELRRIAVRMDLAQADVTGLLARVRLIEMQRAYFYEAGLLPGPNLGSLDALHLATAVQAEATVVVAYDQRLLEAAERVGIPVLSPR